MLQGHCTKCYVKKFAVNAVQQIDSAIMSGLQRMPWIAVFSAGDETPSTSTMFWPTKAMHSRPLRVLTSLLRTPVEQQHWILIAADVAVFLTRQLALRNSSPAFRPVCCLQPVKQRTAAVFRCQKIKVTNQFKTILIAIVPEYFLQTVLTFMWYIHAGF